MAASPHNPPRWKQDLCGAHEIAQWANVTTAQVTHWAKEDWFPAPADELKMGRVWRFPEVVLVLTERGFPKESYFERYPAHKQRALKAKTAGD